MAPKRRAPWLVYGLCALLVVDVLAWATWRVLALEKAERAASAEADAAQRERLALWQMDSAVSALLARESARPYFEFRARYAADLPYGRAWDLDAASRVRTSSLAAGPDDRSVRMHFQIEPDGSVRSPQADASEAGTAAERVERLRAERLVVELDRLLRPARDGGAVGGLAGLGRDRTPRERSELEPDPRADAVEPIPEMPVSESLASIGDTDTAGSDELQRVPQESPQAKAEQEVTYEADAVPEDAMLRRNLLDIAQSVNASALYGRSAGDPAEPVVEVGLFQPRWLSGDGQDPELIFERGVLVGGKRYLQGVWVDWPSLRADLLAIAVRQMPGATLEPVLVGDDGNRRSGVRTLATIPVRLRVPGSVDAGPFWTPARVTLAVSWVAALVALAAIGVVLRTAIRLAERRGRFVAAVTHELRSPITSLRLHTDLLERAPSDEKRASHISLLRDEAARLGDVIDSVLVYAGMRSAAESPVEVAFGDAIDPIIEGLRERVERAGGRFTASIEPTAEDALVRTRPGSAERILGNLVDNACRYGVEPDGGDDGAAVRLHATLDGGRIRVRVSDDGPGIAAGEREAIFADFYRGAGSARVHRGMGLGLALARALARSEGGDLRLVEPDPGTDGGGACFEWSLRVG